MKDRHEFGTTTTFESKRDAEEHGRKAAKAKGYRFLRVERYADGWTPVWTYAETLATVQTIPPRAGSARELP